ncbi:pentapeptide repeat-containing protein [Nocardia tenerifensis]|uniref:pentapeptide repeat-containing protein n=1 Tax=Nocardia tenerifensis TaxID=228006 RepID=UPI00030E39CC|nr:pentapeptide repeat-containing protein [Nocardia tenerifensis]
MFPAVTAALLAGLGVAVAAYAFLRWLTPVDPSKQAAEIDVTRVALTVVAGVGGVVALVIAYRRQRDLEQSRFVERFGAAAAQLGATDVAVRIAGVYAMAGVADESDGRRRQQCIDVLCGYLRLPYDPELGANHQSKLIVKRRRTVRDRSQVGAEQEQHLEYRQNDREVRATIVRVIADHLRPAAEYSWSANDFDFRTAHLEDTEFSNTTFAGTCRFERATFSGTTRLDGATFTNDVGFGQVTFAGIATFDGATFCGHARFGRTTFGNYAGFRGVTFFDTAEFDGTTFSDAAGFHGTTWYGRAGFDRTTFAEMVGFGQATFMRTAGFGHTTFAGYAGFRDATFSQEAGFGDAKFANLAEFQGARFVRGAWFGGATFSGDAVFDRATFSLGLGFVGTTFGGGAVFDGATFSGDAVFDGATFSGDAVFDGAAFFGETRFLGVDFGGRVIRFVSPRQWGPPAPVFDWDQDSSQKPGNVLPQDWPPVPEEAS